MKKKGKKTAAAKKRAPKRAATMSSARYISVALNAQKPIEERVAALTEIPRALCEKDKDLERVLDLLSDTQQPSELRLTALQTIQAASFSVVQFASCRGDYIATLRKLVEDPDLELRQRVLGILAREKDGFVQKKLLEGLKKPEKALVAPEKALQLLSYDVHADAYAAAREIIDKPPNATARREAFRLLAADATAAPLFEKALRNKEEAVDIRQVAAAALQAVRPEKLQEHAREILLDPAEQEDMQTTSLTALTYFGDAGAVDADDTLVKRVQKLGAEKSTQLKQSAGQFLSKYVDKGE